MAYRDKLYMECHGYDLDGNPIEQTIAASSYDTRKDAEAARELVPHPHNWYVWQMNDGWWHVSLMTNRRP